MTAEPFYPLHVPVRDAGALVQLIEYVAPEEILTDCLECGALSRHVGAFHVRKLRMR